MPNVLLCSHNANIGVKVLYCLSAANYVVDVVSFEGGSATGRSRYRRHAANVPSDQIAEWINQHAPSRGWSAVLADDLAAHGLLNAIAGRISVPAFAPTPLHQLQVCHNKWQFYTRLAEHGFPVPPSILVEDHASIDFRQIETKIGFPLLIKPLDKEAGKGIEKFTSMDGLKAKLTAPGLEGHLPLKIQRFISGPTLGLSLLALDGRIFSHDVQRHAENGSRHFYSDPEILRLGQEIVKLLNYGGPAHIDFIRDTVTGTSYILEFNCRFWTSVAASMWRGGNFPALAARIANKLPAPEAPTLGGCYFQPGAVAQLFRSPNRLVELDRQNWRGFWQAASDPLPHLAQKFRW